MITSIEIAKLLKEQARKNKKDCAKPFDSALIGLGVHLNLKKKKTR